MRIYCRVLFNWLKERESIYSCGKPLFSLPKYLTTNLHFLNSEYICHSVSYIKTRASIVWYKDSIIVLLCHSVIVSCYI